MTIAAVAASTRVPLVNVQHGIPDTYSRCSAAPPRIAARTRVRVAEFLHDAGGHFGAAGGIIRGRAHCFSPEVLRTYGVSRRRCSFAAATAAPVFRYQSHRPFLQRARSLGSGSRSGSVIVAAAASGRRTISRRGKEFKHSRRCRSAFVVALLAAAGGASYAGGCCGALQAVEVQPASAAESAPAGRGPFRSPLKTQ